VGAAPALGLRNLRMASKQLGNATQRAKQAMTTPNIATGDHSGAVPRGAMGSGGAVDVDIAEEAVIEAVTFSVMEEAVMKVVAFITLCRYMLG